jgi:hypothetical protein
VKVEDTETIKRCSELKLIGIMPEHLDGFIEGAEGLFEFAIAVLNVTNVVEDGDRANWAGLSRSSCKKKCSLKAVGGLFIFLAQ